MKVYRLSNVSWGPTVCGVAFANPSPDMNSPVRMFTCTCAKGHDGPHVAHCSDIPVAIAIRDDA